MNYTLVTEEQGDHYVSTVREWYYNNTVKHWSSTSTATVLYAIAEFLANRDGLTLYK